MSQQNSIENLTVAMGAGELRIFMVSGEYFEILEAPNPIDVLLSDINGAQRARMYQASASFFSKGVDFAIIQITSASAQTIRFVYGTGESGTRRATGSMTISGAVALDAATLLALEQINVRPEAQTGFFSDNAALVANTPLTVFAPAANVNGALLLSADIAFQDTANQIQNFISKASAPVSFLDGSVLLMAKTNYSGASAWGAATLPKEQFLAAGQGLYFISNAACVGFAQSARACRYRLL